MELISIIVPVYNAEKYIVKTIESIKKQTYKNLEVIFINDGSTDNSKLLIEQNYPEAILVNQENKGLGGAVNSGILKASGKYFYTLAADDELIHSDSISRMSKFLKNSPDIVFSDILEVSAKFQSYINTTKGLNEGIIDVDDEVRRMLIFAKPTNAAKLYRIDFFKEHSFEFSNNLKIAIDSELNYRAYAVVKKIAVLKEASYIYNVNLDSVSHQYSSKIVDIVKAFKNIEDYYEKNNFIEKFGTELKYVLYSHLCFQIAKLPFIQNKDQRVMASRILYEEFDMRRKTLANNEYYDKSIYLKVLTLFYRIKITNIPLFSKLFCNLIVGESKLVKFIKRIVE